MAPLMTAPQVEALLVRWGWRSGPLQELRKLYGGFSGSNYFVKDSTGQRAVLKVLSPHLRTLDRGGDDHVSPWGFHPVKPTPAAEKQLHSRTGWV